MKRLTLTVFSAVALAAAVSPFSAPKVSAQLFESTPPEGADPAVTDVEDTTDPDYKSGEYDSEVEAGEDTMAGESEQEMDGEPDGEGLEPRFEEESDDTLSNS